jgi:hypothetical protein
VSSPRADLDPWRTSSWDGAEDESLAAGARLSLPERLLWLEQSARFARRLAPEEPAVPSDAVAAPISTTDFEADPRLAPGFRSLLELLSGLGGAQLLERWTDGTLAAGLVGLSGDRRLLLVERTDREGIKVLLDPTATELAAAREGHLWDLWNADRAELLAGAI